MRASLENLAKLAADRGNAPALSFGGTAISYADLAQRVAGRAESLKTLPPIVAILAENSADWIIADLALSFAGKTLVPLPTFFSPEQLAHVCKDAGVGHILTSPMLSGLAGALDLPLSAVFGSERADFDLAQAQVSAHKRIIYTSGTTGAPKGVVHGVKQLDASAQALLKAVAAGPSDRYLSVLPYALLLEQMAAIAVPLLAGAEVILAPDAAPEAAQGNLAPLVKAVTATQPTVSVMVPAILQGLVAGLAHQGLKAPESLRFVAVGGAPVPANLAEAAWHLGVPAHEGYGLSECCSVVAVNRLGARTPGSCGTPLDGLNVDIADDGEIIVTGPTVMEGYLNRAPLPATTWATGDLGAWNADGTLKIIGRKDNVLVTPGGRNISPEWIEALAHQDPAVMKSVLTLAHDELTLVIIPAPGADRSGIQERVTTLTSTAPDYAQPNHFMCIDYADAQTGGLIAPSGEPRRKIVLDYITQNSGLKEGC